MALVEVAADNRYLVDPNGQPFFALGINYAGFFDRAWKMWAPDQFDPELIARDFRKAQQSGFNAIRIFAHPALIKQIRQDDFDRLDQTLSMAQDHNLLILLTLNDAHDLHLERVSEIDAKIIERYQDVATIFAYDLENEPVFYNLAAAIYPAGHQPPLHTARLVDHYGQRVSQEEALDLQRQRRIPAHLEAKPAYYYINALRLFLEYDAAINRFVRAGKGSLVDFMLSAEAEPWHPLITVLDETVAAWLGARMGPLQQITPRQLLTVSWNWLHFAALPANERLDFQMYHNYGGLSYRGFQSNITHLESLRRAFPQQPIFFGEFGWSNQSSSEPTASYAVPPELTGLYEAATYAYLRAHKFGGGFKWMLNDVTGVHNPYEASFGVFSPDDKPKPIREMIHRFDRDWPAVDYAANFTLLRETESGLAYRFDLPGLVTIGGHAYQDGSLNWEADGIGHCLIKQAGEELVIESEGSGQLSLTPWELIPTWNQSRETDLYRVFDGQHRTRQRSFEVGQTVELALTPGAQYVVAMGREKPVSTPEIDPRPGEHVVLLPDADQTLQAALPYIRRFAPDFTFAPDQVDGRWAYVTVIASPEQIPEATLEAIRGAGAQVVERISGDTLAETEAILADMIEQGRRFRTAITPGPSEPPIAPGEPPPAEEPPEIYTVQPGDTLSQIAKELYGDSRLWTLIFEANRDKLSNPGLIRVGMELRIPPRE